MITAREPTHVAAAAGVVAALGSTLPGPAKSTVARSSLNISSRSGGAAVPSGSSLN